MNRFGCELLGHEREAVLGSRIGDFAADPQTAIRSYRSAIDTESPEGTTQVRRADGTVGSVRFRAHGTAIGGLTFYIGIAWPGEPGAAS